MKKIKNYSDEFNHDFLLERGLISAENYSPKFVKVYIKDEMDEEFKLVLIRMLDFVVEPIKEDNKYRIIDLQTEPISDIEKEVFDSVDEILNRLDVYFRDICICLLTENEFKTLKKKDINEY